PQPVLRDFDGILGGPDLPVRLVDVAEQRVQRGRLARAGGAHAQDQAVRLFGRRLHLAQVAIEHPELVDGDRLARGQDAHDHVLVAALRRQRGHAQLDVPAVWQLELDLAVLRLAPFGDVEHGDDLDPRDQRTAEGAGDPLVLHARAVDAQPDHRVLLQAVRLDVDVRRARLVGVHDDLVREPDHRAVVLVDLDAHRIRIPLGLRLRAQVGQDLAHARAWAAALAAGGGQELLDVLLEADGQLHLVATQRLMNGIDALDVLGVVDQHDRRSVALA